MTKDKVEAFLMTTVFGGEDPLDEVQGDVGGLGDFQKSLDATPDPVASFIKTQQDRKFRIPEMPTGTLAKSAEVKHGDHIETHGKQTWTHTYSHGEHVASKLHDPDLENDGLMHFDGHGNEISGDEHEALLKEPTAKAALPIYVEESLAKLTGLGEAERHAEI